MRGRCGRNAGLAIVLLLAQWTPCPEAFQAPDNDEDGQFDTAYHEHLSFFTAHSFRKAADLAGLNITGWQVTPIHGQSCLVTMMKLRGGSQSSLHRALQPRLQEEVRLGLTEDFKKDTSPDKVRDEGGCTKRGHPSRHHHEDDRHTTTPHLISDQPVDRRIPRR